MEERFIRENNTNYFVIETSKNGKENYQLKMLKENNIESLLSAEIRYVNNNRIYYYNINSKQLLSAVYEGKKLSWPEVMDMCAGIINLQKQIERYMLNIECVIMDIEHIYINLSNRNLYFIYCPEIKMDFGKLLKDFMEFILEHLDHSNRADVTRVYSIYQKILQNEYNMDLILREALTLLDIEKDSAKIDDKNLINGNLEEGAEKEIITEEHQEIKTQDKYIFSRYIIPFVRKENVSQEREELSKIFAYISIGVQMLFIIVILILLAGIISPKLKLIKLGMIPTIGLVMALGFILNQTHEYLKTQKVKHIFIKTKEEEIEYSFEKETAKNQIDHYSNNSLPINKNIAETNSNIIDETESVDERNTVLLSELVEKDFDNNSEFLLKYSGKDSLKDIHLKKFPYVIGSLDKYCDTVIQNKLVSRMHLRIIQDSDGIKVEDLNSTNGTLVNGKAINSCEKTVLSFGDIVEIAGIPYTFHIY